MNTRPNRHAEIFTEALQLPAEERAAFLDRACGGDAQLLQRVTALLASHEQVGDFLEEAPQQFLAKARETVSFGEKIGDRIGRFKLLQQIGEGGLGVVFMAEQEEPVRRKVALKIIKPGMDTKSVIARFEAERQALAMMDHPNIARMFEAGATESGRPYFVMELVRGVKITDYCDQHSLTIKARLQLFVQVCRAVQHAHQKGIIHRDIKPSNILVTTTAEGGALPVVIDFGIAKAATNQPLTDKTLFTEFQMLVGTPAYMSPEQAALTNADVDTRTDIYSLGVLLYELLTGAPPFDSGELLKAGLDEVRRVIREKEPVRPSTRLSTMAGAELVNFSKHRGEEAPKLIRAIRGDVDWIVMEALEKDRTRRYATANGLAMDIERYLAGEAVLARPPSASYKARKFMARNKLACVSVALIFILLSAGLAVTARLLLDERHARERAQRLNEIYNLEETAISDTTDRNALAAEKNFRRSIELRNKYLDGEPPNPAVVTFFVVILERNNKFAEADALLRSELAKPNVKMAPYNLMLLRNLGADLAMKGRWSEAARSMSEVLRLKPENPDAYHALLPVLVAGGNISKYRDLCRQAISRFAGTQDPSTADQIAKDCLTLPSSGADLNAIGELADLAIARGTNFPSYPFFQCCKALAEYRTGNYAEAIKWADAASKRDFSYSRAESRAVLAMAQFRAGQTNEARASLKDCSDVIEKKFPKLKNRNLGEDWRDWIISQALHDEALQLVEGPEHGCHPFKTEANPVNDKDGKGEK